MSQVDDDPQLRLCSPRKTSGRWSRFAAAMFAAGVLATPAAAAERCPATNFTSFVNKFVDNLDLQRRYTSIPLATSAYKDANPEPVEVRKRVGAAQIKFPIVPDHQTREERGYKIQVISPQSKSPKIVVLKPDTDDQTEYTFRRGSCWTLVHVFYQSL